MPAPTEFDILLSLERALAGDKTLVVVSDTVKELKARLQKDLESKVELEELPLKIFEGIPSDIKSCKLILVRAGTEFETERHPNSHQRTLVLMGSGVITLIHDEKRRPQQISADGRSVLERTISIPPNRWHQPTAGAEDWTIITFQTVSDEDLIEEYLED